MLPVPLFKDADFKSGIVFQNFKVSAFSNPNKVLDVHCFEGDNFKSGIGFQKLWAQISKYGQKILFGSKSITFLILTKIRLCVPYF